MVAQTSGSPGRPVLNHVPACVFIAPADDRKA